LAEDLFSPKQTLPNSSPVATFGCGFNRSMQHLISNYRGEDVENEAATEDLLYRS
jgi:hypothetical protein